MFSCEASLFGTGALKDGLCWLRRTGQSSRTWGKKRNLSSVNKHFVLVDQWRHMVWLIIYEAKNGHLKIVSGLLLGEQGHLVSYN